MAVKVSEKEINNIKKDSQHKEIIGGLNTIAKNLKEQNSNENFEKLLTEKLDKLTEVVSKIELSPQINLPEQKKDIVNNINLDVDSLVQEVKKSVTSIKESMGTIASAIQDRPKEWKFKVQRDSVGYINEVNAIGK